MQSQQPNGGLVYYTSHPGAQQNQSYVINSYPTGSPSVQQYGGPSQPSLNYYQAPSSPVKSYITDNQSDIYFGSSASQYSPNQRMGNQQQHQSAAGAGGQTYRIVTGNRDAPNAVYTNNSDYVMNSQPHEVRYAGGNQPQQGAYQPAQPQIAAYPMGSTQKVYSPQAPSNMVVVGGSTAQPQMVQQMRASPQPPAMSYVQQPQPQPQQVYTNQQPKSMNYSSQPQPQVITYSSSPQQQANYSQPQAVAYKPSPPQPQPVGYSSSPQPASYSQPQVMQVRPPPSPVPPPAMGEVYTTNNHHPPPAPRPAKPHDPNKPQKRRELPSSQRNSFAMDNGMGMEGPPQFVAQPKAGITVMEGDPITISARVKPAGDSSLKCEWYRNGKPLSAASRFNPTFDRGYAVLEFLYTHEDDGGDYYCIAESSSGRDQSSTCHITVHSAEGVVTDTQLPEESMVANLAAMEEYLEQNDIMRNRRLDDDRACHQAPVFVRQLVPQLGLRENDSAHFECIVEPAGDPNLVVEWFKDGKPVQMGCRFNSTLDRGFAILDIMYCRGEDSGQYCCLARNSIGTVQSNTVQLHCTEEGGIITQSALSKDSIAYLESLDSWNSEAMAAFSARPTPEESEEPCAPKFVILPKPLVATEGTPARFLVRADGNPRPRVQWYINGDMIASSGQGGNWRIFQDGGISYLEFHRCGHPDTYQIHILAKNQHGEATADTTLTIEPQVDYRPDLKHVLPENNFRKLMALRHVECSKELVDKMHKPKADAVELRKIERISEHKGRATNITEVEETENLYMRIQANLRSGRQSQPPSGMNYELPPSQGPVHVGGGMAQQPQQNPVVPQSSTDVNVKELISALPPL